MSEAPLIYYLESKFTGDNNNCLAVAQNVHPQAKVAPVSEKMLLRYSGCGELSENGFAQEILTNPKPDIFLFSGSRDGLMSEFCRPISEAGICMVGMRSPDQTGGLYYADSRVDVTLSYSHAGSFDELVCHGREMTDFQKEWALFFDHCPTPITVEGLVEARREIPEEIAEIAATPGPTVVAALGSFINFVQDIPTAKETEVSAQLLEQTLTHIAESVKAIDGSLLLTTSRRTANGNTDLIRDLVADIPAYVHDFSVEGPNPYRPMLSVADRVVVTGDSISMTSDALVTGKPVFVSLPTDYDADLTGLGLPKSNPLFGKHMRYGLRVAVKNYMDGLFKREEAHPISALATPNLPNRQPINSAPAMGAAVHAAWQDWKHQRSA